MNRTVKVVFSFSLLGLPCLMLPGSARANTITVLNFDSVTVAPGSFVNATAYLSSFGITFSVSQAGTIPAIYNGVGTDVTAVSGSNWFSITNPPVNNSPISYTLTFAAPLDSLSFDTVNIASVITYPTWNATAYDGAVQVGATVGQSEGFGIPAQLFSINGPDITSITFSSFSTGQTTDAVGIDNLTLVTSTPEPSSLLLFGTGLLGLVVLAARKKPLAASSSC
jgi:hypothetical protein